MTIPRFPEPVMGEPRDSEANREAVNETDELIEEITARRSEGYERLSGELAENHGAETLQTFWLIKAMVVDMPLGAVSGLAEREDVLYIRPDVGGIEFLTQPGNASTIDDINDGRFRINSDPYFNLGLTGGFIGLIDSGVLSVYNATANAWLPTHRLLSAPSNIEIMAECRDIPVATCSRDPNVADPDDCFVDPDRGARGHGTGLAAIITGNSNLTNAFRGVTGIIVDSFNVRRNVRLSPGYPSGTCNTSANASGPPAGAIVAAFQEAVRVFDRVISIALGSNEGFLGPVSLAADAAFDAGAAVIASNGNDGPAPGTVNSPGNAHKAIGVGTVNVITGAQFPQQSVGPKTYGGSIVDVP